MFAVLIFTWKHQPLEYQVLNLAARWPVLCLITITQSRSDRELEQRLGYIGAVLIERPKACGKTATAT